LEGYLRLLVPRRSRVTGLDLGQVGWLPARLV
jgi:hypothetical protein